MRTQHHPSPPGDGDGDRHEDGDGLSGSVRGQRQPEQQLLLGSFGLEGAAERAVRAGETARDAAIRSRERLDVSERGAPPKTLREMVVVWDFGAAG